MNAQAQAVAAAARFTKIGELGELLDANAPEWVAVFDAKTGLTWSAQELDEVESQQAAEKVADGLTLCGFKWQLSTREQLLSLVDDTRFGPAIDTTYFPGCKSDLYWTRSPAAYSPADYAWYVYFYDGSANWYDRDHNGFVRAVRASQ